MYLHLYTGTDGALLSPRQPPNGPINQHPASRETQAFGIRNKNKANKNPRLTLQHIIHQPHPLTPTPSLTAPYYPYPAGAKQDERDSPNSTWNPATKYQDHGAMVTWSSQQAD
ncbi:uncharacterized protein PADG_08371 [Paracoccidioides brasiliensis Pb18]|uniref:Uncharacterized protein n=1 Tax=Paracoccidioides brasiliensis (strain Pb18) TaxID=502780 RepID=C1GLY0_PARBD|nr:uncharacterized protein PADG_08371 [Paracoccidioides brasiliensis Pb18]EEH43446.2 hypothetical protein PADG_08371 [Paracoccidioides brasiliensis Pb18]